MQESYLSQVRSNAFGIDVVLGGWPSNSSGTGIAKRLRESQDTSSRCPEFPEDFGQNWAGITIAPVGHPAIITHHFYSIPQPEHSPIKSSHKSLLFSQISSFISLCRAGRGGLRYTLLQLLHWRDVHPPPLCCSFLTLRHSPEDLRRTLGGIVIKHWVGSFTYIALLNCRSWVHSLHRRAGGIPPITTVTEAPKPVTHPIAAIPPSHEAPSPLGTSKSITNTHPPNGDGVSLTSHNAPEAFIISNPNLNPALKELVLACDYISICWIYWNCALIHTHSRDKSQASSYSSIPWHESNKCNESCQCCKTCQCSEEDYAIWACHSVRRNKLSN